MDSGQISKHIENKQLTFKIQTISMNEAKLALKRLKPKMSAGISGIPKGYLKTS